MNDLTNASPPARPDWAQRVMIALQNILVFGRGDGRLAQADLDLVDLVWCRLRQRLDMPTPGDGRITWDEMTAHLLDRAVKAIEAESGR